MCILVEIVTIVEYSQDWYGANFFYIQIRHQTKTQLDHLKDMIILLEFKLVSSITLDAGPSRLDTLSSSCKFSSRSISCGKLMPVYINALSPEK